MSFGDRWVEVTSAGPSRTALSSVVSTRPHTGPKSLRCDDIMLVAEGTATTVIIDGKRVGVVDAPYGAAYAPVLAEVGAVQVSGSILINAEGHPGNHLKLFTPAAHLLISANTPDPAVPIFFAHARAGGVTLAHRKTDHALIEAATSSWWAGAERSVWVVLDRHGEDIAATLDGFLLPDLTIERTTELRRVWDQRMAQQPRLQFEGVVYEIKAGRQLILRHQL